MTVLGWVQIVALVLVLTALTPLVGGYMARVYQGEPVALTRALGPLERLLLRSFRVVPGEEQGWKEYGRAVLLFSTLTWVALYVVLRTQGAHPFNPQGFVSGPA